MRERLRKLHVGDAAFTWKAEIRAARGADGRRHRYIRVRVWGAGKNGCVLQADLLESPGDKTYAYPSAAIVRRLVAWGLAAGWTPGKLGGTFVVSPADDLVLTGLTVVHPVP